MTTATTTESTDTATQTAPAKPFCHNIHLGYSFNGGRIHTIQRGFEEGAPVIILTGATHDLKTLKIHTDKTTDFRTKISESTKRAGIATCTLHTHQMDAVFKTLARTDPGFEEGMPNTYVPEHAKAFIWKEEANPKNLESAIKRVATDIINHHAEYRLTAEAFGTREQMNETVLQQLGHNIKNNAEAIALQLMGDSTQDATQTVTNLATALSALVQKTHHESDKEILKNALFPPPEGRSQQFANPRAPHAPYR
jgi:hypothetical protein